jgi:hypothetical protein
MGMVVRSTTIPMKKRTTTLPQAAQYTRVEAYEQQGADLMNAQINHTISARILGFGLALLIAWTLGLAACPTATFAAERSPLGSATSSTAAAPTADDPFAAIGTKLENTAKNVSKIATPIAIICIVIVLVMYLFAPLLPEIAQQNKGYIVRALVIVALISFVPEIVKAVAVFGAS